MEIKLSAIARGLFTATIHGKPAVVAFRRRNRQSAANVNSSVTFTPQQINKAKDLARKQGATAYVAVEILLKGKWVAGFAMPAEVFAKHKISDADFGVSEKYADLYRAEDGLVLSGVHVTELPVLVAKALTVVKVTPKESATDPKGWTTEEEAEIARYQETEGLSRKSALQKMRRRQQRVRA